MDIHKPKGPIHGWREFLGEVGIIVLGVLIALAAEQAVEALRWSHTVHQSETAMRLELLRDDLPQAYYRVSITPCVSKQIDDLRKKAVIGASGFDFLLAAHAVSPPNRSWTTEALKASQETLAAHLKPEEYLSWAEAYSMAPYLQRASDQEFSLLHEIRRKRFQKDFLSPDDVGRISDSLDDLERVEENHKTDSQLFLAEAQLRGVRLSRKTEEKMLREARDAYGTCATPANIDGIRGKLTEQRGDG
jgi:hypothetical protein